MPRSPGRARAGRCTASRSPSRTTTRRPTCRPGRAPSVEALTFPREDSHCVAKLRAAGAVILGKLAHARIRLGHGHAADAQPLGPRAGARRLQRRLGGRGGRPPLSGRPRLGYGRLDPHPGRPVRRGRPEADLRPDRPVGDRAAFLVPRPCRAADPDGGRCGAAARRSWPARSRRSRRRTPRPSPDVHGRTRPADPRACGWR